MPLTLSIRNAQSLENGAPLSLVLDRRGAIVGRAPTVDWCLPDRDLHISSRHFEIIYSDGAYILSDISTNGTFLLGSEARLPGQHTIGHGDVFSVGNFEITAALDEQSAAVVESRNAAPLPPQWKGWGANEDTPPAESASSDQWGAPPPQSAMSGAGSMSQSWAPPKAETPNATPPPGYWHSSATLQSDQSSTWKGAETLPSTPASAWSSATPDRPPPPTTDDVWGRIAASNTVDWARGGFGSPTPPPGFPPSQAAEPNAGLNVPPVAPVTASPLQPAPPASHPDAPPAAPLADMRVAPPPAANAASSAAALLMFLSAAGIDEAQLKQSEAETLAQAGHLFRQMVAGLVVMLEARARAKSQIGAQGTSLELDGNNPLKFARTAEQAILQLLNPPVRGFMPSDRAIEDSYRDLQAHQIATLRAMQGALRATLDRFSPTAIRLRADATGVVAKILPAARDAALWKAYVREFSGVAEGSDEAFMDVFAKEFRTAYEDAARQR